MASANVRLNRKIRRLEASRRNWKERLAAKHREIRKLRVTVRDLKLSRDRWKERAHTAQRSDDPPTTSGPFQPPACLPFVCPQPPSPD